MCSGTVKRIGECFNSTVSLTQDNHTTISNGSGCSVLIGDGLYTPKASVIESIIASLDTVLTLTCAILYICFWVKLRARAENLTGRSDMHKLRWRLSVIVLLDTFCWIPVTILHRTVISDSIPNVNVAWPHDNTTAKVLLISISPAVNPLIYTFTEKNILHSIRKFCRGMKCYISVRRSTFNYRDDHKEELNVAAVFHVLDVFPKLKRMIQTTDLLKILPYGILIRADSCRLPMNQVKPTSRFI